MNQAAQRLFFAVWPQVNLGQALHDLGQHMRSAIGGRVVAADRIHLTLAFLGTVPVSRLDELRAIGESIQACRFQLELAQTGCWKRSAVGWIAPVALPAAFEQLTLNLHQRLLQAGFRVDEKPFAPHVTLLRNVRCNEQPEQPVSPYQWSITDFSLVQSQTLQTGPIYTPLMTWRLR